jgi:hypothetical protein
MIFTYLADERKLDLLPVAEAMLLDFTEDGKRHPPGFLYERSELPREMLKPARSKPPPTSALPDRQARHLAAAKAEPA